MSNEPFRNEQRISTYRAFLDASRIELAASPYHSRDSRVRIHKAALSIPLDAAARQRLSNRFGPDKVRDAKWAVISHTSYAPKGSRERFSDRVYNTITVALTRTEEPRVVPTPEEWTYVNKVYLGEVYIFAFRPWPEPDTQRDWLFSHLPCT